MLEPNDEKQKFVYNLYVFILFNKLDHLDVLLNIILLQCIKGRDVCLHVFLLICICAGAQVHDIFRNNVAMEQGLASMVERGGGVLDNGIKINFSS